MISPPQKIDHQAIREFCLTVGRSGYSSPVEWLFTSAHFYHTAVQFLRSKGKNLNILDIGSSYGYGTYTMAKTLPDCRVIGVDNDEESILAAKSSYFRDNLSFECLDIGAQDAFPRLSEICSSFDGITCFEIFEHMPVLHSARMLNTIFRLLKPGGELYISTPNQPIYDLRADTPDHINEVTLDNFKAKIDEHNFLTNSIFGSNYINPVTAGLINLTHSEARGRGQRFSPALKSIIRKIMLTIGSPQIVAVELIKKVNRSLGLQLEILSAPSALNNFPERSTHIFISATKPFLDIG